MPFPQPVSHDRFLLVFPMRMPTQGLRKTRSVQSPCTTPFGRTPACPHNPLAQGSARQLFPYGIVRVCCKQRDKDGEDEGDNENEEDEKDVKDEQDEEDDEHDEKE